MMHQPYQRDGSGTLGRTGARHNESRLEVSGRQEQTFQEEPLPQL